MTFDKNKYTDNPALDFKDISNEAYRTYVYPPPKEGMPNVEVRIENPEAVAFKAPYSWTGGGSHRITTVDGTGYYLPPGWVAMYWNWKKGSKWGW